MGIGTRGLAVVSITLAIATSVGAQDHVQRAVAGTPLLWAKDAQSGVGASPSGVAGARGRPSSGSRVRYGLGAREAPSPRRETTPQRRFVATMLATGVGSAVGAFAGAYAGVGATSDDDIGAAVFGAIIGSWAGGSLFGAAASRRPARAVLGSALGVAAGIAVIDASGGLVYLTYPLTHGLVTALIVAGVGER